MAKRNEKIFDILIKLPWWVSVVIAALVYFSLAVVLPSVEFQNPVFKGFATGLPHMAKPLAILFLVPAPIAFFNSWRKRRLLDQQQSLDTIRSTSWREFEELIAEAYRRSGYTVQENSGKGPDGGVDIRLSKDGRLYLVQCKHWKSQKVGVGVVRELYGIMAAENAFGGMLVCTGVFTQEAKNFAAEKPIDLIDGPQLDRMVEGIQERPPVRSTPRPVISDTAQLCPRCNSALVKRVARRGKNAGATFIGCSTFPECRYTRSLP